MIKAIIFDCFGVLITDALASMVNESGLSIEEKNQIIKLISATNRGEIRRDVFRTIIANKLSITEKQYVEKIKTGEVKNQLLLDYISELHPHFKIGLLSNISDEESLKSRFSDKELSNQFDVVVASGHIGYAKPQAQAYEITASLLGVLLSECVMIDDIERYCQGAIGVGMRSILYTSFNQMKQELISYGVV